MNREEAKKWLPIMEAFAAGKNIQRRIIIKSGPQCKWEHTPNINLGSDIWEYRIAPDKSVCRVALAGVTKNNGELLTHVWTVTDLREMADAEKSKIFVKWLTPVIEYDTE